MASSTPFSIPADMLAVFESNPWTKNLLANTEYLPVETGSRRSKPETGEDAFFATTLGTSTTIPHLLTLKRKPDLLTTPPTTPPRIPTPPAKWPSPRPSTPPTIITLLNLAEPGISGHPGVAHGGVISTLLDEIMSLCVAAHMPSGFSLSADERGRVFTMQLDVRFKNPVVVPGLAVVKIWCVAHEGRKFWLRGQFLQEAPEEKGAPIELEMPTKKIICADSLGFFVLVPPQKL
ncbi:hypothetical protein FQN57_004644 [Myotisia sp. PD_48]|nr:hypothetical protein FQN57_004644 [Myotisia sp. PD_48]